MYNCFFFWIVSNCDSRQFSHFPRQVLFGFGIESDEVDGVFRFFSVVQIDGLNDEVRGWEGWNSLQLEVVGISRQLRRVSRHIWIGHCLRVHRHLTYRRRTKFTQPKLTIDADLWMDLYMFKRELCILLTDTSVESPRLNLERYVSSFLQVCRRGPKNFFKHAVGESRVNFHVPDSVRHSMPLTIGTCWPINDKCLQFSRPLISERLSF